MSAVTSVPLMHTFAGKKFNPLDPNVDDINILDIAHHLSNICRYGGACKEFYSVAQHSVICSWEADYPHKKWALLHDSAEAYIGDIINPLKVTDQYQIYREVEENLMKAICKKFNLPEEQPPEVHDIDVLVRHTEMRDFGSVDPVLWVNEVKLDYKIKPLPPVAAKILFLDTFSRLFGYDVDSWKYFP